VDIERKKDLSIYYYIKDLFVANPTINVVDGFPVSNLVLPTVSIEASDINLEPFELGNEEELFIRIWYIDVFGKNKTQRDDLLYKVLRALQYKIPVYDYDMGFPPDVTPSRVGALRPRKIRSKTLKVMPELVDTLYYRASVSFTTEDDTL
jgi:hypothetical protein